MRRGKERFFLNIWFFHFFKRSVTHTVKIWFNLHFSLIFSGKLTSGFMSTMGIHVRGENTTTVSIWDLEKPNFNDGFILGKKLLFCYCLTKYCFCQKLPKSHKNNLLAAFAWFQSKIVIDQNSVRFQFRPKFWFRFRPELRFKCELIIFTFLWPISK